MPTIFISGAASGIGLAFFKYYAASPSNRIIAIDRSPIDSSILPKADGSRIRTIVVDITSPDSISLFTSRLLNDGIDLVIHSAGVRGLVPAIESQHPTDVDCAETIEAMDAETMARTFQINTIGSFLLLRALLPNLRTAQSPKVAVMGSRLGSISSNVDGFRYAYRASKAALNAVVKSLSIDSPDVTFAIMHPGRVETSLVRCKEEGAISVDESVGMMVQLIEKMEEGAPLRFFDRFGEEIGW